MQRTKVFAVAVALVSAATAAILLTGGASAASWHVYQGEMFAGHAYGLQVPAGAESIEFAFEGAPDGKASIGVYEPAGAKVGFYALAGDLITASVANPDAGQYVVYVYELNEGALKVRVNSEDKPTLDLAAIKLSRQETKIGEFKNGALDQVVTSKMKKDPVFVTLLYEGSARKLDATVASQRGDVVTIVGETATAFSPGVWTTMQGTRTFDAVNLEGNVFTVTLHAEQFEGTIVLTTLALDIPAPAPEHAKMPAPPAPERAPKSPKPAEAPVARPIVENAPGLFALDVGAAVAFYAPAGMLQLVDPAQLDREAAEDAGNDYEYDDDCQYSHGLVSIYAPDDSLLTVIELDHDNPVAQIKLPVSGEYVAFVHYAEEDVILAAIAGATSAPQIRQLAIEQETFEVAVDTLLLSREPATVMFEHTPLMVSLAWESGEGVIAHATLENENGIVASTDGMLVLPGMPAFTGSWQQMENYAKGEHTLTVDGVLYQGNVVVTVDHYVREQVVDPVHTHEHEEHDHEEEESAEEPEQGIPLPPFPAIVAPIPVIGPL